MSEQHMSEVPVSEPVITEQQVLQLPVSTLSISEDPVSTQTLTEEPIVEAPTANHEQSKEGLSGESPPDQTAVEQDAEDAPPLDTFTDFPKLPLELRLKIWSFTENFQIPRRWFSVAPYVDSSDNRSPPLTILRKGAAYDQKVPFTTMAVCSEARKEALLTHVKWNSMGYIPGEPFNYYDFDFLTEYYLKEFETKPVFVNPAEDIFYIGAADWPFTRLSQYATGKWVVHSEGKTELEISEAIEKTPTMIDNDDIVFGKVQHLAVGFGMLHESSASSLEEFFMDITYFKGLKDLTIVLPDGKPEDVYPFYAHGYFGEIQTETGRKISGLLTRYLIRLLDEHLGFDPSGKWKRPAIKVVFHTEEKSSFLGHTESYHQGIPYTEDGEFDTREKWEEEWSSKIYDAWKDILQELQDFEASLPPSGFTPSWKH